MVSASVTGASVKKSTDAKSRRLRDFSFRVPSPLKYLWNQSQSNFFDLIQLRFDFQVDWPIGIRCVGASVKIESTEAACFGQNDRSSPTEAWV